RRRKYCMREVAPLRGTTGSLQMPKPGRPSGRKHAVSDGSPLRICPPVAVRKRIFHRQQRAHPSSDPDSHLASESPSTLSSQISRHYDGNARGHIRRRSLYSELQMTPSKIMHGCFIWRIFPVSSSMILVTELRTVATVPQYRDISTSKYKPRFRPAVSM